MRETTRKVRITQYSDGTAVWADLISVNRETAEQGIDNVWWCESGLSNSAQNEMDSHWSWARIAEEYSNDVLSECLAIESSSGELEGAVAFQVNAQSRLEPNAGCVYVGWLATAPRNRKWLTSSPVYKGIGTVLLFESLIESYRLGLKGRIALQSLPSANTLAFYEHKGFERTDLSQDGSNLIDYELPSERALEWLRSEGVFK